jgi:hypothetical protein
MPENKRFTQSVTVVSVTVHRKEPDQLIHVLLDLKGV